MPITKSAKKKMVADTRKRVINLRTTRDLKQAVKPAGAEALPASFKAIDKAAKRGIIHKNKAARLKSKLAKRASTQA